MPELKPRTVFEIRPAKDSLTTHENFVHFLASLQNSLSTSFLKRLFGGLDTITLEIATLDQTIFFIVTCPGNLSHLVKSQIAAQFPDVIITPMTDYLGSWLSHASHSLTQMKLTGPAYLPIVTIKANGPDPLISLLGVLSKLPPNQAAVVQFCLSAATPGWSDHARGLVSKGVGSDPTKFEAHPQKVLIEEKITSPGFDVDVRLAAIAPDLDTAETTLSQLVAALGTYFLPESNSLSHKKLKGDAQEKLLQAMATRSAEFTPRGQVLNLLEIASLYHFPNATHVGIKNIAWGKNLKGEPPANLPTEEGLSEEEKKKINFFARTEYKNRMTIFGIKNGNDRRRHVYILGKSGTGKSTLIANMAVSDIRNHSGVAVVDPHGDLAEIVMDFIPDDRINDVAYLDPSEKDFSFRINPLYAKNPEQKELLVSGIMSVFKKIWADLWSARMEYILRNTLLTLVYKNGATFLDIPKILTNDRFRSDYLRSVTDPTLLSFWRDEYAAYSEKFRAEAISAILNKVGQFVTIPMVRNIIGSTESSIDLEKMMDDGKIIIVNLAQGKIGEDNASLLGAMIITQIQIAAMNRINRPEEERRDFYLYVDEFQNFATTAFVKILSEARKFRLNLILANQYTAQLPEEIQKAIFGNAGTIVSFVVGADDATRLMAELGNTYTQNDLVSLAKYQIVTKLMVDGTMSTPFPAYTLSLPFNRNENKSKVIEASQKSYYRKNEELPPLPIEIPQTRETKKPLENIPKTLTEISSPTPEALDVDRQKGLRPTVIGCFINNGKILLLYRKVYNLWQLPQGGIETGESLDSAFSRVMTKELGESFYQQTATRSHALIKTDEIEFPSKEGEMLVNQKGESVPMKGKSYYFVLTDSPMIVPDPKDSEYDDSAWVDYDEGLRLLKETTQGGKFRVVSNTLYLLKETNKLKSTTPTQSSYENTRDHRPEQPQHRSFSRPSQSFSQSRSNEQGVARQSPQQSFRSPQPSFRSHPPRTDITRAQVQHPDRPPHSKEPKLQPIPNPPAPPGN